MDAIKANSILGYARDKADAQVFDQSVNAELDFQVVQFTLVQGVALAPESALKIGFPFQSLYVVKSTHPSLTLKFRPNNNSSYQGALELTEKDNFNFGMQVANGYIHWDAQSFLASGVDQTVTVLFAMKGDFKSGSLSAVKGGIVTDQYSSALQGITTLVAAAAAVSLSATLEAAIAQLGFSLGKTPRQLLIQNNTTGVLYVGPTSTVDDGTAAAGANKGYQIQSGDSFKWNNKTPLYGFSTLGGVVNVTIEY